MYRLKHALLVLRAIGLRCNNPRAGGRTDTKSNQKLNNRTACAYCRKSAASYNISNNNRVYNIVELLKQIS